jgi:pilus assembly protein Flp/PilA
MHVFLSSPISTIRRVRKRDEQGASAVEYGLLVAAVAASIVAVVFTLGTFVKGAFTHTSTCIAQGSPGYQAPLGSDGKPLPPEPCNN